MVFFASLFAPFICGIDPFNALMIGLIALVIAIGSWVGVTAIEKENTVITTEFEYMEVHKYDAVSIESGCGNEISRYIIVGNRYLIEVSPTKYAELSDGDFVLIEINTKTKFGEVTNTTARLKE
jgi:hypothetical protein